MSELRVLFVADRRDAPFRYRCVHACRQLRRSGAVANIAHVDDATLPDKLEAYSALVLFRLPWSERVGEVVLRARRSGVPLLFDCDDLVFDPAAASLMPFRADYAAADWETIYGEQLRNLARTLEACDVFIGSTPALAAHAARRGKRALVHPNVAPEEYVRLRPYLTRHRHRLRRVPTIGYFAGSDTHDRDFAVVVPALRRVLEANSSARLVLAGYMNVGQELRGLEGRVVRLPYVSFRVLPWALSACHVTLAPLAEKNEFTDSKSALKFFEPGMFGIPAAATPVAEMARAIEHGVSGWLCESEADWFEALTSALDEATSARVGRAAMRAALVRHSPDAVAGRLAALLREHAAPARGPRPSMTPLLPEESSGQRGLPGATLAALRDTRDLAVVLRTLRTRAEPSPEPRAVDRFLDRALDTGRAFEKPTRDGALLLVAGDPESAGWSANEQLTEQSAAGELAAKGADAHWVSPKIELGGKRYRYLLARLRVTTSSGKARTQFYFSTSGPSRFRERSSASFGVVADGVDRTYLVDLWRERGATCWRRGREHIWLRCDPMTSPGRVRLLAIALLPDGWTGPTEPAEPSARRCHELPESAADARRMIARIVDDAPAEGSIWLESKTSPAELRALLRRQLKTRRASLERIEHTETGGARCLLRRRRLAQRAGVDVVVPVYNALPQTLRCLRSVVRHLRGDARLVIIDDGSSDPGVLPALRRFAKRKPGVVLLENPHNLGFVATCNRGFDHAGTRDVVLLNSDTLVFRGFLQRLQRAAYADDATGVVCPLSNNATILSVPELGSNNQLPAGMSAAKMASLIRRTSRRRRPVIVTPVGFCMYVRRAVLDEIGGFDVEHFGRGFGEENDFGERAKKAGWTIRAADDVYVWHEGKASFGDDGWRLERENAIRLEARQPGYHAAVASFVRDNPLAPIQKELGWHLQRKSHALELAPLFLLHASPLAERPGGTEHIVRDAIRLLRLPRATIAYPSPIGVELAEVYDGDLARASRHVFALSSPIPRFCHEHSEAEALLGEIVQLFRVDRAHMHHSMYWPLSAGDVFRAARVPYTLALHDYYAVCPSQNLLDLRTFELCCPAACGDRARTAACMTALHHELGIAPPDDPAAFAAEHRVKFARLLDGAEHVQFPSRAAHEIVRRVHPALGEGKALVVPHGYVPAGAARRDTRRRAGPMRIALIGEIAYASKGSRAYLDVMERCRGARVEWHIFGPTDRFDFERRLRALEPPVRIVRHGPYARDQIVSLLRKADVDVGLVLSIWPETFSLTLSELLAAGVPVVASRQGALAERLAGQPYGKLVDGAGEAAAEILELASSPERLLQFQAATRHWAAPQADSWVRTQRTLDEVCRPKRPLHPTVMIRSDQAQRLFETRRSAVELDGRAVQTTRPSSRHAATWWYPWAERLKPWVPESLRAEVRRRLADDRLATVRRFRMPGPGVRLGSGLRLDARYVSTARFTALTDDPQLVVELGELYPDSVNVIRFNLWCSHPGEAYAQIYWRHKGDPGFDEHKSIVVPLNARAGAWHEYVVRVSGSNGSSEWHAGDQIVELRFDPVNFPGLFCLGELALCHEQR